MIKGANARWTVEQVAKLVALWNAGVTIGTIARKMERTPESIAIKVNRLRNEGVSLNSRGQWTPRRPNMSSKGAGA